MTSATTAEYVRAPREDLVTLPNDRLALGTSSPPADGRDVVSFWSTYSSTTPSSTLSYQHGGSQSGQ